jgi:catechol 2,3-dioxygenase-like lactoylglutathione lyase family enzyme
MLKLLVSASFAATLAVAQAKAPTGDVLGVGNFSHIVADLDKSLAFYRDVLGLELIAPPRPFDPNPAIMKLGNTLGAQSRMVQLRVPGSEMGVEIIEYKDIDRKPAHPRFQDPGAANLIVRFRDLDAVIARVKNSGVSILSVGGKAGAVRGSRVLFIKDPDGFVCELSGPEAPAQGAGPNVTGGGFEVTVADADKIAGYYRALGFETIPVAAFNGDQLMMDTAGTPGAQFRQTRATIPGTSAFVGYIEFKDIDRNPLQTRVQDPGTAILQLNVRDVDAVLPKLKAAGFTAVSTGGEPVDIGPNARIAIVRDPNNLFLELIQRKAAGK